MILTKKKKIYTYLLGPIYGQGTFLKVNSK